MSAIMAKAMNSTVGSDNFLSFDQLLYQQKIIAPSENLYCTMSSSKVGESIATDIANGLNTAEKQIASFEMLTGGSFTLATTIVARGDINTLTSSDSIRVAVSIYKGQTKLGWVFSDLAITDVGGPNEPATVAIKFPDIEVLPGENIRVMLYCGVSNPGRYNAICTLASPIEIRGDIKDRILTILE